MIIHFSYKDSASTPQDAGKSGIWERLSWMGRPGSCGSRKKPAAGTWLPGPLAKEQPRAAGRRGGAGARAELPRLPGVRRSAGQRLEVLLRASRRGPRALGLAPRSESPPSPGSGLRWSRRGFPRPEPRAPPGPAARARGRPRGPGGRSTERTGIAFAFFLFRLKLDLFIFYLQRSKNSIHITRQTWEDPKISVLNRR